MHRNLAGEFGEFGYPEFSTDGEKIITTREGNYAFSMMDIRIYKMLAGQSRTFESATDERAILLQNGEIEMRWDGGFEKISRKSLFNEWGACLHVPAGNSVTVTAVTNAQIIVQATENTKEIFKPVFYSPEDIRINVSGEGLCNNQAVRKVSTIIDYNNAPYSNLVIGEVISDRGNWSAYIPHHHPQPEVYYYEFDRPEGFGACFVGDCAYKIKQGSFGCFPGGKTHPQCSAPGFQMYTCWMIRHFDNAPWTDRVDDPAYEWLLDAQF